MSTIGLDQEKTGSRSKKNKPFYVCSPGVKGAKGGEKADTEGRNRRGAFSGTRRSEARARKGMVPKRGSAQKTRKTKERAQKGAR